MYMIKDIYYYELNIICLCLLFWITLKTISSIDKQTKNLIFLRVASNTALLILIDIIWKTIDELPGKFFFYFNNFIDAVYLAVTGVVSFYWLLYVLYDYFKAGKITKKTKFIISLPLIALAICSLSSPWTHLLFYVDPLTNHYHRAPFHFIQEIIAYGYFVIACILLVYETIKEMHNITHIKHTAVFMYVIIPFIAGIVSYIFPGVEIIWQAASISLLVAFYNMQIEQISVDALTGLNNRRTFNSFLHTLSPSNREGQNTFLYMIDINLFKNINDHYGHPEGDGAITETATIIKAVFGNRDAFISRYGGDEFCVVYHCANLFEAESIRDTLYERFEERNSNSTKPYRLSVSVGFAQLLGEDDAATTKLIKDADIELYKEKQKMHTTLRNDKRPY